MRRIVVIPLVLFSFVIPAVAQTGAQNGSWVRQKAGTMAWLRSVFFLDHNRGWAVGSKGTLLKTVDGGLNWKPAATPTTAIVRDIFFLDEDGFVRHDGSVLSVVSTQDYELLGR